MTERKSSNSRTGTQVSREHLQVLSKSLTRCWMDVARYLEMKEETIESVEERNPRNQEKASMEMLLRWKSDCGRGATYQKMDNALRKAGRTDLAEKLQDLSGRLDSASHAVSRERSKEAESRDETDAPTSRLLPYYEMSSTTRGICLLLTYDKFEQSNERIGNESDKVNLEKIFKKLGFEIIEKHNLKLQATISLIRETAAMDHGSYDCFVLFICSHGGKDTFSTADYEKIAIQEVLTPFRVEHCPSLANKPKIFFFNSCRGKNQHELFPPEDDGEHDRGPGAHIESYRPNEADFCISLSTVPGYVSKRNRNNGTRFVQSLFKCVNSNDLKKFHLIDILTLVNKDLIDSYKPTEGTPRAKQICQEGTIISTLDKAVYFSSP